MGDVIAVDFKEFTQLRAGVGAAEAIGAKHSVVPASWDEGAHLIGVGAHVVGGGNHRASAALELASDPRRLRRFCFWVEAVETLTGVAVPTQFVEAGAGMDVGFDAEFFFQQQGCGSHFAQNRAAA